MTWKINDKEVNSVIGLDAPKRYQYFIKRIVDWEEIWSLKNNEGWVMGRDDYGAILIPVWPHPQYAKLCSKGDWANTEPCAISLEEWLEKWIPGMTRDRRHVWVFPLPNNEGINVDPQRILKDIQDELLEYE